MRRNSIWLVTAALLLAAAASVVALAGFGDNGGGQVFDVIRNPPGGSGCICPANWDPVVCRAQDGSAHYFSNLCVAGCYGYTSCARVIISQ
ncbi:MAG: hypothetical protein LAO51_02485 [Acidobacteriia bacterium]|nr:hypothetical protein [Terriglobia bacterium]